MSELTFKELFLKLLELEEQEHKHEKTIFVTQVLQCLRRSYIEIIKGVDIRYKLSKPLLIGSAIHKYVEYLINKYKDVLNLNIEAEKHVEFMHRGWRVVGRADIVTDKEVWEIKVTSRTYKIPSLLHIAQANLYAYLLNKDIIRIIYFRDNKIEEFIYQYTPRLIDMFFKRLNKLIDALENNQLPEKEEDFWCSTCPYKYGCVYKKLSDY